MSVDGCLYDSGGNQNWKIFAKEFGDGLACGIVVKFIVKCCRIEHRIFVLMGFQKGSIKDRDVSLLGDEKIEISTSFKVSDITLADLQMVWTAGCRSTEETYCR